MPASKNVAHHRARVAVLNRHHGPGSPQVQTAERDLRAELLAQHIKKVVDAAPTLTAEQRCRLVELLEPVRAAPTGDGLK